MENFPKKIIPQTTTRLITHSFQCTPSIRFYSKKNHYQLFHFTSKIPQNTCTKISLHEFNKTPNEMFRSQSLFEKIVEEKFGVGTTGVRGSGRETVKAPPSHLSLSLSHTRQRSIVCLCRT